MGNDSLGKAMWQRNIEHITRKARHVNVTEISVFGVALSTWYSLQFFLLLVNVITLLFLEELIV